MSRQLRLLSFAAIEDHTGCIQRKINRSGSQAILGFHLLNCYGEIRIHLFPIFRAELRREVEVTGKKIVTCYEDIFSVVSVVQPWNVLPLQ